MQYLYFPAAHLTTSKKTGLHCLLFSGVQHYNFYLLAKGTHLETVWNMLSLTQISFKSTYFTTVRYHNNFFYKTV